MTGVTSVGIVPSRVSAPRPGLSIQAVARQLPPAARDAFLRGPAPASPSEGSAIDQVVTGNAEAGATLLGVLKLMASNPLLTLKGFGAMLIEPFFHPERGVERIKNSYKQDGPLEAALLGTLYASTAVTTASFFVMGLALLAAPFTGGASLAVAAAASQVMIWTGFLDAGLTTAILAKDEYDLVTADTPEEYERNVSQLADDYLNTALAWITLPWTDGQTAASAVPQGMAIAGRATLKRPAMLLGRTRLPAFRSLRAVTNGRRQAEAGD